MQELALKAVVAGTRSDSIRDEILRNNEVTLNRATLIARTETAKAVSNLTQARAEQAGVTHYIWRTMEDEAVRSSHAELDGKVFAFNNPPFIEGEGNHHPGDFPNCRCYAEPIIE